MEDRHLRLSSITALPTLARAISIAGNPLFLIPVTVAIATRNWLSTCVVALTTTVPLILVIRRNVRRGTWSDFDVSRHDQRPGLYAFGAPLILVMAAVLFALGAGPRMIQSIAAAGIIFLAGLLGHRFLKLSMHMMFGAFAAVLIIWLYPWSSVIVVPFVAAIGWSRLFLGRHTVAEVVLGTLIGAASGWLAVL